MPLKDLKNIKKKGISRELMIFIWHGFFLSLTMSMIDFNTVFPSLISELIDSKIVFGFLYSIMLGIPLIFKLIFSHFMQYYRYKKKFLLIGIYLRGLSFLGMAFFTYQYGQDNPILVVISFFFWISLFSLSGGFAGLAFTEIIGKLFKKGERGRVYAVKQFSGSLAAFIGGVIISRIFSPGKIGFPQNYSLTLFIGFVGLAIASVAFWLIEEPPSLINEAERERLGNFIRKVPGILKQDKSFLHFILIENITGFSLMILPFYMVFARESFGISGSFIGRYLLFQVSGMVLSNFFWGYLSDKQGSRFVVQTCILLGALIPVVALLISPLGPWYYSAVFFLIGFIISGRRIGFDPYLLDISPEDQRTIYLGIRGTMNILVVLLPVIGGMFISFFGYYLTFSLVSIIMLGAFYLIRREGKIESCLD